ncbi:flagellar hook-associated protein FlgK [Thauera sp. SDU_THAU2]|uniref:flagellar hook-associated protein FlgK n=1 Tax=Thauera sp. SDU_THAU2 TaxID=3136633 RepID=UPI00311DE4D0
MAGLLNIGMTGLNAAQAQLLTTGHNVTNAGVAGYHRQTVIQSNATPQYTGAGFFGQGTRIADVTRSYDRFLEGRILASSTRVAEYAAYNAQINQINNLLADSTAGLSPVIEGFFAGVQEVASNPTSVAARQSLISSAEAMVSRFQALDARLTEVRQGVEGEIESTVAQINMYSSAIADMNQRIMLAQVGGPSVAANDLHDQRDQLIAELNTLVKVSTVEEDNGSISVFVGSGQGIVVGGTVTELGAVQDPNDPQRKAVALMSAAGVPNILPERVLTGGVLGGLLSFRRESLDMAQNNLGLIAAGIAKAFNDQHALGIDLNGALGQGFFKLPTPAMMPAIPGATAEIVDQSKMSAEDYVLYLDTTGAPQIRTQSGNPVSWTQGTHPLSGEPMFTVDGVQITVPSLADIPGQGLLIQPTRYAARDISVSISDPRKVAAGDPVSAALTVGLGDRGVSDFVTGVRTLHIDGSSTDAAGVPNFAAGELVLNAAGELEMGGYLVQRYDPATDSWVSPATYEVAQDNAGARYRALSNPADATRGNDALEHFAFEFTAKGEWTAATRVGFSPTEAGVADNRNAVALGALQTSKVMLADGSGEPTATFQATYAKLVTAVGNKTREVQVGEKAQKALLDQATDARDSISGVNLDEEAANLIRYQQAYQASARVMSVAQTLFDAVLSIAR